MIEVLKQAYQLLLTEPHAPTVCDKLEVIFRQAIAELESQEPVAQERESLRAAQSEAVMPWIGPLLDAWEGGSDFLNEYPALDKQLRRINRAMETATPPAQPQRKPLTEQQVIDLFHDAGDDPFEFAKAIEAAHGIKE